MKLSIALGVYNGTNFLAEQLESYLAQTRIPDELVAVDDGSTDGTVAMLESFAARAPFHVRILKNELNIGSTATFERAISACTGDIIFPSDHDDVWMPHKLETFLELFEQDSDVGLVFCDAELIDGHGHSLGMLLFDVAFPPAKQEMARAGRLVEVILESNVVGGATSAFRSNLRELFCPIPTHLRLMHDGWVGLILSASVKTMFLSQALNKYRQHSSQQVGTLGAQDIPLKDNRAELTNAGKERFERELNDLSFIIEKLQFLMSTYSSNEILPFALSMVEQRQSYAREGFEHFTIRSGLTKGKGRFRSVFSEALGGRYSKYSNGAKSILRDLIES